MNYVCRRQELPLTRVHLMLQRLYHKLSSTDALLGEEFRSEEHPSGGQKSRCVPAESDCSAVRGSGHRVWVHTEWLRFLFPRMPLSFEDEVFLEKSFQRTLIVRPGHLERRINDPLLNDP
jgi:hypothetical protein